MQWDLEKAKRVLEEADKLLGVKNIAERLAMMPQIREAMRFLVKYAEDHEELKRELGEFRTKAVRQFAQPLEHKKVWSVKNSIEFDRRLKKIISILDGLHS